MVSKIKFHIKEIARHRDKLRDLILYINEIDDCVKDGIDDLEDGLDRISEKI